jgi:hypothetical protein
LRLPVERHKLFGVDFQTSIFAPWTAHGEGFACANIGTTKQYIQARFPSRLMSSHLQCRIAKA